MHGERGFCVYDLLRSFKENLMSAIQLSEGKPVFSLAVCLNCCLQNRQMSEQDKDSAEFSPYLLKILAVLPNNTPRRRTLDF